MATERINLEQDAGEFFDWAYGQGWTDGLPVIPPTPERVKAMMSTVDLDPDYVVAQIPPRRAQATVEKLAVNAVMAGCLPEYFPVIVAAVEAVPREEDGLRYYWFNTTTNSGSPMYIVNGPIRNEIGMNCSWSLLGPGNRPNATIGRAMSLIMINIGGRIPGEVTKSTFAQPARYTCCFGEFEEDSPWEPLHVERGFRPDESTVTTLAISGTINSTDIHSNTPEELMHMHANSMKCVGSNNMYPSFGSDIGLILSGEHAKVIAQKYTKQQAKEFMFEQANKIPRWFETEQHVQLMIEQNRGQVRGDMLGILEKPEHIVIMVGGGHGGYHSVIAHTFAGSHAVTVPIRHRRKA